MTAISGQNMGKKQLSRRDTLKRFVGFAAVATAGALAGCSGGGDSTPTPDVETPQGAGELDFAVEYDSEAGQLRITYASSVNLTGADVYVRGEGVDSTGSWTDLGGNVTDGDTIAPFNELTLPASSDYDIQIVWERDGKTITFTEASAGN